MRVGVVQTDPQFGQVTDNIDRALQQMEPADADLFVLPELFATGYQFSSRKEVTALAEPVPAGATTRRLSAFTRHRRCWVVAGLPERSGQQVYNSAVIIGPKGIVGIYRKVHLFGEERRWFTPGNTGFHVWKVGPVRVGVMVCFDWLFPESARTLALKGAELICHPANLVLPYCPEAMRTRSLENHLFTATADRVGTEARGGKAPLTYIGQSQITDPWGDVLFRAPATGEAVGVIEIDHRRARQKRLNRYNDLLLDRRPQWYRATR